MNNIIDDFVKEILQEAIDARNNGFEGYTIEEVEKEMDRLILSKTTTEKV